MFDTDGVIDWIDIGMAAFRHGRPLEAADAFRRAVELNPSHVDARACLALALSQQLIPGAKSEEHIDLASQIESLLRVALQLDQKHWAASVLLGRHLAAQGRFDEAREMFRRALEVEPEHANVQFAIAKTRFDAWVANGHPEAEKADIVAEFEQVVRLDPLNDPAMEYLGVVLESSVWHEAAADARSENAQRSFAEHRVRPVTTRPLAQMRQWIEMVITPFRPPVPPPPPEWRLRSPPGEQAAMSFEPLPDDRPRPVRVHADEQAKKLIRRVEPVIHGEPFADNELRFVVVIGADGAITEAVMISGNCWLQRFGRDALRQWLYEPSDMEVVTEVRVTVGNC